MSRVVTNKYINGDVVTRQDFYEGINVENPEERRRIAKGRIILTLNDGRESIWILNDNDIPKLVAQPASAEIPANILEYIASAMTVANEYADNAVENGISEYNTIVIESADTMYNELKGYIDDVQSELYELSAYTMNLKFSDHFMLTEGEYIRLKTIGELVVDGTEESVSSETCRLNDLSIGDIVKYSTEIYYCIYENGGGGGGTEPTISGSTIIVEYEISGTTVILDDLVTVDEENHTLIFNGGGGGSDVDISGTTVDIDSLTIDNEHTMILNDDLTIENNTITIN